MQQQVSMTEPKRYIVSLPRNQRGLLVGQTGSGKSTLAKVIIEDKQPLLIIDPKREFEPFQGFDVIAEKPRDLSGVKFTTLVYRPTPEYSEPDDYEDVFKWVYYTGDMFVYIDELTAVTGGPLSYPKWLRALYVQGRSLNIGTLAATQRPSMIPTFTLSESRKFWKFFLLMRKDNERMAEFMGEEVLEPHRGAHSFYYKDIMSSGRAKEYELQIDVHAEVGGVR